MMNRDLAVRTCYEIPGQTWPAELCWLYDQFRKSRTHAEVGIYCGRSLMASCGAMDRAKVYAVDLASAPSYGPIPAPEWLQKVRDATLDALRVLLPTVDIEFHGTGSLETARLLQARGVQLDSVFIDASHEYEHISGDIQAWRELVRPGGIIAGHDFWPPDQGVMRAVHECFDSFEVLPNTRIWYTRR